MKKIKNFLVLLLCLGLCGCASTEYALIYKNALKTGTGFTVTKEKNYQKLKERVAEYFVSRGYKSIVFADQKNGFFVFAKEGDFQVPCKIILKYTEKAGADKIRIDIVKGDDEDELVTDSEVSADIQAIGEQIKKN